MVKFPAIVLVGIALSGSVGCQPIIYTGEPAGLVPNCPGVQKNATISSRSLPRLQLLLMGIDDTGAVFRKTVSVSTAHKIIARDKLFDFKRKKTVLYTVGFFDSSVFPHTLALGNVYAKKGYNVLISETFAFFTHIYPQSARLAKTIGIKLGEMLFKLTQQGLSADNLELVGMSLGAHVAGFAAKKLYSLTGTKPARITGLDPAGPCFRTLPPENKLNKNDGIHVDIIHTNIDGFGLAESLGHIDYYVNGGEFQPSDIAAIPCLVVCSHAKSLIYWWQALQHPKKFIAIKCDSIPQARLSSCYNGTVVNYLGAEAKFDRPGIFYLPTSNLFPYYRGRDGLKPENEIYTSVAASLNAEDDFVV